MVEWDVPQVTILTGRMQFSCWISKATDAHTKNVQYVRFFCGNSGYANASQYYVYVNCSLVLSNYILYL